MKSVLLTSYPLNNGIYKSTLRRSTGLIVLFILMACTEKQETAANITGTYKSNIPNAAARFLTGQSYATGTILKVNKDSTYSMTTCSQLWLGRWKVKKDSLYLYCSDVKFIIDSLNYVEKYKKGTICSKTPEAYSINGDILLQRLKVKGMEYAYDKLKKEKTTP